MSDALTFIDTNLGRFREELNEFLRIPSISAKSEYDDETSRSAEWLASRMREAGLEVEVLATEGHPIDVLLIRLYNEFLDTPVDFLSSSLPVTQIQG